MKEQTGVETHWTLVVILLILLAIFFAGFAYMFFWMWKSAWKPTIIVLEPWRRAPKKKFVINKIVNEADLNDIEKAIELEITKKIML